MPVVIKKQINASVSVCLWQIQETEAVFLSRYQLSSQDLSDILSLKLDSRRLEKWACRAALSELIEDKSIELSYSSFGQPIIRNGNISFSHTKNYGLAVLSHFPVGADIEQVTPKILKLKHKFMNPQEMNQFNAKSPEEVTLIWSAKEAVFKWFEKGDLDFCSDMMITKNPLKATLKNEIEIPLYKMEYLDFMIVIAATN